ncbi:hypothetical protein [Pusillimonas minor]|uniref:Uncharacterized protein n=1 Tax=Pusillimonas minor TaxID=2697024 RepID=A0A842HLQ9_9BURK|nr:hypothetical protein [Pusillimonas minor]MBC2769217.1 hypothetical protein [Pusillimonas minor]
MKTDPACQPTARDHAALRQTLLKLTATHKIVCTVVVVVVAVLWFELLTRLVAFGRGIDYSGLEALGGPVTQMLKRYNPFFWWALAALCTLIMAYFLVAFVRSSRRRVDARMVGADVIAGLVAQLSEPALTVLRWVWEDTRFPITVGDLQQTATELRRGRAAKIQLSREHAALLSRTGP